MKKSAEGDQEYTDRIVAVPGQVYTVSVYFANSSHPDAGTATGTRVRLQIPGVIRGQGAGWAHLSADNAVPHEVSDGFVVTTRDPDHEVALRYVSNSAIIRTGPLAGTTLSDDLFTGGTLIGCDQLDGHLPPGQECAGRIELQVRIDQPNFEILAQARAGGGNDEFATAVELEPGTTLVIQARYQNTGSNQQDNVVLRATLPPGLRGVTGSSRLMNANNPSGVGLRSDPSTHRGRTSATTPPAATRMSSSRSSSKTPRSTARRICGLRSTTS